MNSSDQRYRQVKSLPKIDLHLHLDGAVRTGTILDLADRHEVSLPAEDADELESYVTVPPDCRSLSDFLNCFETLYPVLQYTDSVERVAFELCEDLEKQGVIYAEVRFAPHLLTREGATQEEVVRAALRGLERGGKRAEINVNLILCLYRNNEYSTNVRTLELAEKFMDRGIVGIDLAGDESKYDRIEHPELFKEAREQGLGVTIHAGEAGPASNVREALDSGARRIGHAVRSFDDPGLMDRLKKENIPLELCFTSNLQTQAVETASEHPLQDFYRNGNDVTINTDDPRISRTDINREYCKILETFDFGLEDCRRFLTNAADAAFVSDRKSEHLKERIQNSDEDYSDD